MPDLYLLLAQSSSIPETLDTLRASPYAPWIGGALLVLFAFALLKAATKFIIRSVGLLLVLVVGFLGWSWWSEEPDRSLHDIRSEWFEVIQHTDFSKDSIQGLMARSGDLLNEALEVSQAKGRQSAEEALAAVSDALDNKIREAASKGQMDAKARFETIRAEVQRRLAELNSDD